jgi:hypothetical protein
MKNLLTFLNINLSLFFSIFFIAIGSRNVATLNVYEFDSIFKELTSSHMKQRSRDNYKIDTLIEVFIQNIEFGKK